MVRGQRGPSPDCGKALPDDRTILRNTFFNSDKYKTCTAVGSQSHGRAVIKSFSRRLQDSVFQNHHDIIK